MISYILVFSGILFSAAAQAMLKQASLIEVRGSSWFYFVILSISFYGISFLIYAVVLRYFPISKISPVMTIGTVVLVVFYGLLVVGETLSVGQLVGVGLGIISIWLILM